MNQHVTPSDLELAALISSKICHDVIGPVGAIYNGLEILEEDTNLEAQSYALDVIRNVTEQASNRLQFARFAFGAAGSAGSLIDLATAEKLSVGFIGDSKHKLSWRGALGHLPKDRVKLLLNLVASAVTALPRGGQIAVEVLGSEASPAFRLTCTGTACRLPQYLTDFVSGTTLPQLDSMSIQAYYTWRLSEACGMQLEIGKAGDAIVLQAEAVA